MGNDTVFGNLQGSFDQPLEALTKQLRDIATAYIPDWQELSREQRISKAEQVDKLRTDESRARFEKAERELHAPPKKNSVEDERWFKLNCQIHDCQRQIYDLEIDKAIGACNIISKENRLSELRVKLASLNKQFEVPFSGSEPAQELSTPALREQVPLANLQLNEQVPLHPLLEIPSKGEPAKVKPVQRGHAQDTAILTQIKGLGYDPLNLPKNKPGKAGVKSAVRHALSNDTLFIGTTVFDKAWERLSANGEIVIQ